MGLWLTAERALAQPKNKTRSQQQATKQNKTKAKKRKRERRRKQTDRQTKKRKRGKTPNHNTTNPTLPPPGPRCDDVVVGRRRLLRRCARDGVGFGFGFGFVCFVVSASSNTYQIASATLRVAEARC